MIKKNRLIANNLLLLLVIGFCNCTNNNTEINLGKIPFGKQNPHIDTSGKTILSRILVPNNYQRIHVKENTFAQYLRKLPLKPPGSTVKLYNGKEKFRNVHIAVINIDIGKKDLQQCADAIMRLKAEYLFGKGEFDKIHFNFTNGFRCDYSKWIDGYRIKVNGYKTTWVKKYGYSNTYKDFLNYMELIFMYAGTLSLEKELTKVELKDIRTGDVFIQGGSPGHAVIVVDMAVNKDNGSKIFLLAQSYMPAQDIHILVNKKDKDLSPWYSLTDVNEKLYTPEWTFNSSDLRRFKGE